MQLGGQIAFENYRARLNRIFYIGSDELYNLDKRESQFLLGAGVVAGCVDALFLANSFVT